MALTHTGGVKKAATDAATALFALKNQTAAPNGVKLKLYTGAGATGTLLVTLEFSGTGNAGANGFGAADGTSGIATAVSIANGTVVAGGTAIAFKIDNLDNAHTLIGTVGETGGGEDILLNNNVLVVDQIVQITSMTYRAVPA